MSNELSDLYLEKVCAGGGDKKPPTPPSPPVIRPMVYRR